MNTLILESRTALRNLDGAAWAALVECSIGRNLRAHVADCVVASDVDDVMQTIYVRAIQRIGSYDPARPIAPWLHTIARNEIRRYWQAEQARAERLAIYSRRNSA